ncbi:dienelactone hydrolase family protein [Frankia sp. AgPm24]|uniref:alpha/beta hydrolase family protein n=1 Tax=Frankia sp. AgPm24 TaxID=631128 RepID=UPI0020100841|nr:dienelactone hydrolase family protein [Frankia sp. AgPm24]MCK9923802.1 dienelactone hydrolase family protein [Frankia sp. AgPm24]
MSHSWRLAVVGALMLGLATLLGPAQPPGRGAPVVSTAAKVRPAASGVVPPTQPDPGAAGPWPVGYRTVRLADPHRLGRVLTTSLWYPARPDATAGSTLPRTVELPAGAGTVRPLDLGTTGSRAAVAAAAFAAAGTDTGAGAGAGGGWSPLGGACPVAAFEAAPDVPGRAAFYPVLGPVGLVSTLAVTDAAPASGPFPLVVFSHGSAGSRVQAATLLEGLASHGYVVAAPDHTGDTLLDAAAGQTEPQTPMAVERSRDLSAVLDALTDPSCQVRDLVRSDQIATVGFSFGGLTSIVSSIGLLDAPADPRVRASVGLSAATSPLPAAWLAENRVPTLLLGGTRDTSIPLSLNAERAFGQLTSSRPRVLVTVADDTHNSFTDVCRQAALVRDRGMPAQVSARITLTAAATCGPPMIDPVRAELLVQRATVAFLDWQLRGRADSGRFLTEQALGDPSTVKTRTVL